MNFIVFISKKLKLKAGSGEILTGSGLAGLDTQSWSSTWAKKLGSFHLYSQSNSDESSFAKFLLRLQNMLGMLISKQTQHRLIFVVCVVVKYDCKYLVLFEGLEFELC